MHQCHSSLIIDGREVPTHIYWKERRLRELSDNAKLLLAWLQRRQKKYISCVEIQKTLTPLTLRRAKKIRELMNELARAHLVGKTNEPIVYTGRQRRENFKFIQAGPPTPSLFSPLK